MGDTPLTLGERLRKLRTERDMSLSALAEASGVSKPYLSQLESGKAENPTQDVIRKLSHAFDVSISELLGEELRPDPTLPAGLQEFVDQRAATNTPLTRPDVEMLLNIRYRGKQPRTAEDWFLLYETIKRIIR